MLCFVVLEGGDRDELGGRRRQSVSTWWAHPKNLRTPGFGLIPCKTGEVMCEPLGLASLTTGRIDAYREGGCDRTDTQSRVYRGPRNILSAMGPYRVQVQNGGGGTAEVRFGR